MRQVVVIHGGHTFDTYEAYMQYLKEYTVESLDYYRKVGWKGVLQEQLGEAYDVVMPSMPCKQNAKYTEWTIWFEKLLPLLTYDVVLVGHSLGGIFLAKYLAEHTVAYTIRATFLIAAPYDVDANEESLADFVLPGNLSGFAAQGGSIFLYQSSDDPVVPCASVSQYEAMLPQATVRMFQDRGHFNQETFPELVDDIKKLA